MAGSIKIGSDQHKGHLKHLELEKPVEKSVPEKKPEPKKEEKQTK